MERAQRGTRRIVTAGVLAASALALLGNAIVSLLPRQDEAATHKALTNTDLIVAYSRVRPGQTRASQLSQYGLDTASAGTQVLSYLGMMERFMPHDSVRFDQLDPAIRDCVAVQDHCTALVFRPAGRARVAPPHGFLAALAQDADAEPPAPQVMLLIRDGRVAFKAISGVGSTGRVGAVDRQARALPVPFRMAY